MLAEVEEARSRSGVNVASTVEEAFAARTLVPFGEGVMVTSSAAACTPEPSTAKPSIKTPPEMMAKVFLLTLIIFIIFTYKLIIQALFGLNLRNELWVANLLG